MKPKHHVQLALLGIPILLLSPAAQAKDRDKEEKSAKVAESDQIQEEKGDERRAQEAARRAAEAEERAKQAAERAAEKAKRAEESAEAKRREEEEKSTAPDRKDSERRIRPERPDPAVPSVPPTAEKTPPVDMPVVPSAPLKPREEMKPPRREVVPEKEVIPKPAPERETVEIQASEPERRAETQVTEVTREVQRDLEQRKTRIEGREQAQALIDDILGAESRISRAEIAREERFRPRFENQLPGDERFIEVSPDQRREAATYYRERLLGREVEGPPPEFFRHNDRLGDRRDQRVVERVEIVRPRYFNEGRRYVHYDSRAAIPAILMAAQAMNQVRFQPTREIAPMFYEREEVSSPYAMPLPPENYRSQDSVVVSYPVDENSMISSEGILFMQGSTQFSDPYSYDVIGVMADAMKAMPEEERFVIEGHASAEGSYESNMILSQQRAEHIVREIVRRGGVSPYRLLPVGYGESEARHPADAAERLRGHDRRVVVFRMKAEPIAQR